MDQGPKTMERLTVTLPSGLEILPTGAPLAIEIPMGSVVQFPPYWNGLDRWIALERMGVRNVDWLPGHCAMAIVH